MVQCVERISRRTSDFDDLCDAAAGWDQQYQQMSAGQFEGSIDLIQIGSKQVMRERWGRKIWYRGIAPPGGFGFALPLNMRGTGNFMGRHVESDTVITLAPGKEADFVGPEYWDSIILGVSEEEVLSTFAALSDQDCLDYGSHGCVSLDPAAAAALRTLGSAFLQRSQSALTGKDEAATEKWADQFVKLFLWELVSARQGPGSYSMPVKATQAVRKATDLVLGHQSSCIGLTELCATLGVSLRTLHYAFRDVTGMSPAAWLRLIRLNQAHRVLLRSSPEEVLVKQVALDHGFLHFSRFATQYRRHFGASPSETLRIS